jgi:hypothetical protein
MASVTELVAAIVALDVLTDSTPPGRLGVARLLAALPDRAAALRAPVRDFLDAVCAAAGGDGHYARVVASVLGAARGPGDVADLLAAARARVVAADAAATRPGEAALPPPGAAAPPAPPPAVPPLLPAVAAVEPRSALGVLLRRVSLAGGARLFDGVAEVWEGVPGAAADAADAADAVEGDDAGRDDPLAAGSSGYGGSSTGGVSGMRGLMMPVAEAAAPALPPLLLPTPRQLLDASPGAPAGLRAAYVAALDARDFPAAVDALHAYIDAGFGAAVGGGAATVGATTPLGVLTGAAGAGGGRGGGGGGGGGGDAGGIPALSGPTGRVRELLLSAASAAPVGGAALGRTLLHYGLLHLAALHGDFGHGDEAADALRECMRVAQASGDAACASYVLELLAATAAGGGGGASGGAGGGGFSAPPGPPPPEAGAGADGPAPPVTLPSESVDLLRRVRQRASDLGLWRQQAEVSLRLVEHAVATELAAAAAAGASSPAGPSPPRVAMPDWLSVDPYTAYRAGGYCVGVATSSSAAPAGGGGGAAATVSPAVTAAGRDGVGAAALTALTGATATAAAAAARRSRALHERRPSLGGGAGGDRDRDRDGAGLAPAPGPGAVWSSPAPLAWHEVVALHAAGHASRARLWGALPDRTAGAFLAAAAGRCAAVAAAFAPSGGAGCEADAAGGGSPAEALRAAAAGGGWRSIDVDAVVDALCAGRPLDSRGRAAPGPAG